MSKKKYWLDEDRNVRKLYISLWVVGGLLLLGDFIIHRHEYISEAGWFGFYGFYGFVGCVILVLAAKLLRKLVMRNEDYYDS